MKFPKGFLLSALFFFLFVAGCGSASPVQTPPIAHVLHKQASQSPVPLTLQVVRSEQINQSSAPQRSWHITDTRAIQQLLEEIHRLPVHRNTGADTCARPRYSYTLDFLSGTRSMQKDELYSYCLTLTSEGGSEYNPTDTFYSLLTGMLHLSKKELLGW